MFDLSAYNTFKLKVFCREGKEIRSVEDLEAVSANLCEPVIFLGSGSDVLFTSDFEGTVLIGRIKGIEISAVFSSGRQSTKVLISSDAPLSESLSAVNSLRKNETPVFYRLRIGGGEVLDRVIELLIDLGIPGLENLSLIPGTVGAAPVQNVGAYGSEIADFIESVEAFDVDSRERIIFSHEECRFGYRSSYFKSEKKRRLFLTHVNLRLNAVFKAKADYAGLQSLQFESAVAVRERVIALRREKLPDPAFVGNAGSFFKNPYVSAELFSSLKEKWPDMPAWPQSDGSYKLAAGWLIDKAGCRGIKHGRAGTWGGQALVIVNLGQALPHEIVAVASYVCAEVKRVFAVDLIPEVRIYGRYGEEEWNRI